MQCRDQVGHHLNKFDVADARRTDAGPRTRNRHLHGRGGGAVVRARVQALEANLLGIGQRQRGQPKCGAGTGARRRHLGNAVPAAQQT